MTSKKATKEVDRNKMSVKLVEQGVKKTKKGATDAKKKALTKEGKVNKKDKMKEKGNKVNIKKSKQMGKQLTSKKSKDVIQSQKPLKATVKEGTKSSKKKEGLKSKESLQTNKKTIKGVKGGKVVKSTSTKSMTGAMKREQRLRRQQREKDATLLTLSSDAKHLWEQLRRDDCDNKSQLVEQLYNKMAGRMTSLVYAHDTVRVIEWMVTLGNDEIRRKIFEELNKELMAMAKSKYASHLVAKMIKHAEARQRTHIMDTFKTHYPRLMRHKTANIVVNDLYNDHASTQEQNCIVQEFFGPHFKHSVLQRPMAKNVIEVLNQMESKSKSVLIHLAQHCSVLIHKGCYNLVLVQTVIWNYVLLIDHLLDKVGQDKEEGKSDDGEDQSKTEGDDANDDDDEDDDEVETSKDDNEDGENDDDEKSRSAMDSKPLTRKTLLTHRSTLITSLREACVHMLHSREGMRVTLHCLWHGTTKDRKAILKSFKSYVVKICSEEQGYKVMLALFDCVDDTKLVAKVVLKEMIENIEEVSNVETGRKVLMYLMAPRDTKYIAPDVVQLLKEGDSNDYSKKDASVRWKELKDEVMKPLANFISEHMSELVKDRKKVLLISCFVNNVDQGLDESREVMDKLSLEASKPFVSTSVVKDEWNLVEDPAGHRLLKKCIEQDKHRAANGKTFSQCLLDNLDQDGLESWILCNRGCFLLVNMVETGIGSVIEAVKERLKKNFKETLESQRFMGAQLLRKKIEI